MARIIGHQYDEVSFQGISHKDKTSEIGIAVRLGYSYSENNMGFGEGRVLYTVDLLETSPEQSLFILEEPETSLHESAQYEFAKYLLDVCARRHHQIILSTHSSVILKALPSQARKLIVRDSNGVEIRNGISADQIRSILSRGREGQLHICVEDVFARVLLTEAVRVKRPNLLIAISVHAIGDKGAVREAVGVLRRAGLKAIGVRDADVGPAPKEWLYSFPGTLPPEREVFDNTAVKDFVAKKYDVDLDWLLARDEISDHHKIAEHIAREAKVDEEFVRALVIEKYIDAIGTEFDDLMVKIDAAVAS
ncbi:AAA family ATPase [Casimicrobium huifangae]|uniref:AAA family ATPase n=1 Tax=Casimicrobium huifangae TaxID=2591109 RepID=UPI001EE34CE9|nr:AAA family ATPase [Casimicrobium huifangae]